MSASTESVRSRFFGPERWSTARLPLGQVDRHFAEWNEASVHPLHRSDCNLIEKSLETLVALQFGFITGVEPTAVFTSEVFRSVVDVVGLDGLGRIHLVELKKGTLTAGDVEQAEQYMLRFVFRDVADFMSGWAAVENDRARMLRLAIAGLWANIDSGKVGYKLAKPFAANDTGFHDWCCRYFEGGFPSKAAWGRLHNGEGDVRPDPVATIRLLQHVAASGDDKRLSELAEAQEALVNRLTQGSPVFRGSAPAGDGAITTSIPRLVLWLGAPTIGNDALLRVEKLRVLGVDARCFEVRARLDDQQVVRLHLLKEHNPDRDAVEAIVGDHTTKLLGQTRSVTWSLYATKTPSGRGDCAAGRGALPFSDGRRWAPGARWETARGEYEVITAYDTLHVTAKRVGVSEPELLSRLEIVAARLVSAKWADALADFPEFLRFVKPERQVEKWGRLGMSLLSASWRPGIFVGFMLNGSDHGVMPCDSTQGMDLSVMLDTTKELASGETVSYCDRFVGSERFCAMLQRLSGVADWNVCDASRFCGNRWHPIHLRRPLLPLLQAGEEALVAVAIQGVRLLLQGRELVVEG